MENLDLGHARQPEVTENFSNEQVFDKPLSVGREDGVS
jgi:hypothetical protein